MNNKKIEILAPCGGIDSVIAAVRSGADAVYMGAKTFSARAGAENFSDEELVQAVKYCHACGVKVHLTVNTIVFDSELEGVAQLIASAARAGVDALIVQNIGVAMLAKRIAPSLPLHASTQLSIHTPGGAKLMWELGFSRVVLARELNREEIKKIAESCPIETEVFVHGALCMSVSGQCYFSAMLGSRSGNRGRCAQTCRLPFSVGGKKGCALSLKDNSIIDRLRDLQSLGVTSAKIEGRLKRPEYVAAAVKACVQSRDNGFVDEKTAAQLSGVFSRTGFTDGYYTSKRGYEMFGYRKKEDVVSATEKLFSEIRAGYKDEKKRVNISMLFSAEVGKAPTLSVTGETGTTATAQAKGVVCEKAINRPLDEEKVRRQLLKTGGTPYNVTECEIRLGRDVSLPLSAINELRREALGLYYEGSANINKYEINEIIPEKFEPHKASAHKRYARFTSTKIGSGFRDLDLCFVPLDSEPEELKKLLKKGFRLGVEIPRALFSREEKVRKKLTELNKLGIIDALCNNHGAVYLAREQGFVLHGGFGLNFTNTPDLEWALSFGFADAELSFELREEQINTLGGKLPRGIISYGYLPLMLTRNCPNKSARISCRDCGGRGKMKDRLGKTFIFTCGGFATEVLNTVPVEELGFASSSPALDFESWRFSVENYVENVENIHDFSSKCLESGEKTHGLYKRGVI